MSDLKPIIVWSLGYSPNPWKVVLTFEELGLPYEMKQIGMAELKQEPYISLNPNGRVPTIEDPNTGITLWESGAIVEYLIDTYDTKMTLSYARSNMAHFHQTRTWTYFQCSGQGPYFGQKAWFRRSHPERIQSALDRYDNEIKRVTGVLDLHLGREGSQYLVGDKCTYADLVFLPYIKFLNVLIAPEINTKTYKEYEKWVERLCDRPAVKKVFALMDQALASAS
ncbi:hypothetical protein KVR01_000021 [Diaporthe batatas]|uniref:uncharacterized protein n=1 Tax=Diaporthe batatas TaxID=748121 RepID=UPI001D0457A7|nr:uncharacterized protein KVR01_000021 [Diaporthe batatas]KAG8169276.1 hypothetical protein KVR01_000021 [Diaporthe batatas]